MSRPKRTHYRQNPLRGAEKVADCIVISAPLKGLFIRFLVLATRKRVYVLFYAQLVYELIFVQLMLYVFLYLLFIASHGVYIYLLAQKCRFPYLYFRFACLLKIIKLLLPFKNPIISAFLFYLRNNYFYFADNTIIAE